MCEMRLKIGYSNIADPCLHVSMLKYIFNSH